MGHHAPIQPLWHELSTEEVLWSSTRDVGKKAVAIIRWTAIFQGWQVFTRIGLEAYQKHGLIHQVFFAKGDGNGGNLVTEIVQLVQDEVSSSLALGEFNLSTAVEYCAY